MNATIRTAAAAMLATVGMTSAHAATFSGLANTGGSNNVNWFVNGDCQGQGSNVCTGNRVNVVDVTNRPSVWVPNSTTSQWVAAQADPASNTYHYMYDTSFAVANLGSGNDALNFRYSVDNALVNIFVNGQKVYEQSPTSSDVHGYTSFTVSGDRMGLREGTNTIQFLTLNQNNADGSASPFGFRLEWLPSGAGAVPEPATWAMMLLGFGLVGAAARRSRPHATPVAA